jgi:hypothetical protein
VGSAIFLIIGLSTPMADVADVARPDLDGERGAREVELMEGDEIMGYDPHALPDAV